MKQNLGVDYSQRYLELVPRPSVPAFMGDANYATGTAPSWYVPSDSGSSTEFDWNQVGSWITAITDLFKKPDVDPQTQAYALAQTRAQIAALSQANVTKMVVIGGVVATAMFIYFASRK